MPTNQRVAEDFAKKISQIRRYKYMVIVLLMVIGGVLLWRSGVFVWQPLQMKTLGETVFYLGLVTLALSLINDVILQAETDERLDWERKRFAQDFAEDFFTKHADDALSDAILRRLISADSHRELVVKSLASLLTSDRKLQDSVERTYLEPFKRPPRFTDVRIVSRLFDYDTRTGTYTWSYRRSLKTVQPVMPALSAATDYRVFVCKDADIAAHVATSTRASDLVIVLSDFSAAIGAGWFQHSFKIGALDENMQRISLTSKFGLKDVQRYEGCERFTDNDAVFGCFSWAKGVPGVQIDVEFETTLSLKEDPFFFESLQDYEFVESLEIDYSGIKQHCGRVSHVPYFRSPVSKINHDPKVGNLRVQVNGLAGPGEGAILIFRR